MQRILPSLPQMAPGSRLLIELADEAFPSAVRLTSIYSERDAICPAASCRLDVGLGGHLNNVEVSHGGHLELLIGKRFAELVASALGAGRAKAATSAPASRPNFRASA